MSMVMAESAALSARRHTPRRIAVIWRHVDNFVLGSIIALAGGYADAVYVVLDGRDGRAAAVACALGAEVVYAGSGDISSAIGAIRTSNYPCEMVLLDGDGSCDPDRIPGLFSGMSAGCDLVMDAPYSNSQVNDSVLILNNKPLIDTGSGLIAASQRLLKDFHVSKGSDIVGQLQTYARSHGYGVKCQGRGEAGFDVLARHSIGVVVPAYNEELLIEETIKGIPEYVSRIYVVDDCSSDRTPDKIKGIADTRVVSIRHEKNRGVGASIVSGYKLALQDRMDVVAVMAGDNQMDPEQLPRLLAPVLEGRADYVKGNRLINKEYRKGMSGWRSLGNLMLTMITKIGSGYWDITDPQNGYTAISRSTLESLDLDSIYPYYGYCNNILIKLNAFGMRTMDVAIPARYGREKSHIKYSRFILKVAPMIFRGFLWRLKMKYVTLDFHPLVLFYAFSMILLPLGLLLGAWEIASALALGGASTALTITAVLLALTGLQFLFTAMLLDRQAIRSKN